ncbi:MarR family winged helix-turn-helix transcriptional regulator [Streptomyces sp. 7-21]|mgnify:CR=1 FL=1|jgi:DNA-binding MarR family transcriptional regulator|uniref:MarR family winged helix-turn-helix transcriptional regulator n=1 Tax=Streptomyces sp. 7-21 TaxID=2802283 RepID=UPI00191D14D0|nr:MarR family transcriptional regulator [Streptomyces sp. 7-21]MBL1067820.1 MarR family transcriptional regulator [Streptomyces sp. 7-21]
MPHSAEQRLGHLIKKVEHELTSAKHMALRPLQVNVPQYNVLRALSQESGLSGAALARRCMVTPQTMSSVLSTLEGRGLVERKPHPVHGHVVEVHLTPEGRSLLTRADEVVEAIEARLAAAFSPEETETLLSYLGRGLEALAKPEEAAARN